MPSDTTKSSGNHVTTHPKNENQHGGMERHQAVEAIHDMKSKMDIGDFDLNDPKDSATFTHAADKLAKYYH